MLHSCGTGGDPGELCDPTPRGAGQCQSGVCLQLECQGDLAKSVCAGEPCACVGSGCFDTICGDDQLCVLAKDGQAYCLPANVCVAAD